MDNKNTDINYLLYKKVFNNKFLLNLIFNKVKEIHLNIFNDQNLIEKESKIIFKYNEIPFHLIFNNGLIEIFKDKLKTKTSIESSSSPIESIKISKMLKFFKTFKLSLFDFKEFYQLNKKQLFKCLELSVSNNRKVDLFQILVENKELEKLEMVYQDQKDEIETEKEMYYQLKKRIYGSVDESNINEIYNKTIVPDREEYDSKVKSPFSIYFNKDLVEEAVLTNSLDIIKFLNGIGVDFNQKSYLVYYHSITLITRNQLVDYFLNELELDIPNFDKISKHTCNIREIPFNHLYLLEYRLLKKMAKKGLKVNFQFDILSFISIVDPFYESDYKNSLKQVGQLDFIQNILLLFFIKYNAIEFYIILQIIKYLIKFNNNQIEDNKLSIEKVQQIINKIINKYQNNNNNNNNNTYDINPNSNKKELFHFNQSKSIFSSISNYFSPYKSIFNQINLINYNDFNLEKEIKRIYIFEFIQKIIPKEFDDSFLNCVINHASKFQEFHLLNQFHQTFKDKKNLYQSFYSIIINNQDPNLYCYCKENKITKFDESIFKNKPMDIQDLKFYYKLLESFIKYKDFELFLYLFNLVLNIKELKNKDIDSIMEILKEYYNQKKCRSISSSELHRVNKNTYIYIKNNFFNLFNWNN